MRSLGSVPMAENISAYRATEESCMFLYLQKYGKPSSATPLRFSKDGIRRRDRLYFCGVRFATVVGATLLPVSNRLRRGKNGVTSNGILSRAERRLTGAALISST